MGTKKPTMSIPRRELAGKRIAIGHPLGEVHENGKVELEAEKPVQRHMKHVVALPRGKRHGR